MPHELLIDLAAHASGARVLEASDEFFGAKDRLIADGAPAGLLDGKGSRGWGVDGWMTRRTRSGHDWAIVRLGLPGVIRAIEIDTTHITGDHPAACSVEAAQMPGNPNIVDLVRSRDRWRELVVRHATDPDTKAVFAVTDPDPATHIRLVVYPDGGVARLRCFGEPVPRPGLLDGSTEIDLAALASGGRAVACSDAHGGSPNRMLVDGDPDGAGDGWLTRRRRTAGDDWSVIRLAGPGEVRRLVVDTSGFTGDAPRACSIDAAVGSMRGDPAGWDWQPLVARTELQPDHRRTLDIDGPPGISHLRLSIHPDGGIARFRAYGVSDLPWTDQAPIG